MEAKNIQDDSIKNRIQQIKTELDKPKSGIMKWILGGLAIIIVGGAVYLIFGMNIQVDENSNEVNGDILNNNIIKDNSTNANEDITNNSKENTGTSEIKDVINDSIINNEIQDDQKSTEENIQINETI